MQKELQRILDQVEVKHYKKEFDKPSRFKIEFPKYTLVMEIRNKTEIWGDIYTKDNRRFKKAF